jgi:hypothetical protein
MRNYGLATTGLGSIAVAGYSIGQGVIVAAALAIIAAGVLCIRLTHRRGKTLGDPS